MTDWIFSILVDPRIQAPVVVVMDFFVVDRVMVEPDGVGESPVKRLTWFEGCLEIEVGDEGGHFGVGVFKVFPLTLPDVDEPVREGQ